MWKVWLLGKYFNPRPPRGGRPVRLHIILVGVLISIHAPREGGDINAALEKNYRVISIHAPREGGDAPKIANDILSTHFNPRPPRGGRRVVRAQLGVADEFQSTPPARGATAVFLNWVIFLSISIHATREGGDCG